jgi:uncharacterized protein
MHVRYNARMPALHFRATDWRLAVCRLGPEETEPDWARTSGWLSITRTPDELSIVCEESCVPEGIRHQAGWRVLMLEGPFDFGLTGILASMLKPLAESQVPIFAISTFDTDWVLVPGDKLEAAVQALRAAGHQGKDATGL